MDKILNIISILLEFLYIIWFVHSESFLTLSGCTYKSCYNACDRRARCISLRYVRRYPLCTLYTDDVSTFPRQPGTWTVSFQGAHRQPSQCGQCKLHEVCDDSTGALSCSSDHCGRPPEIPGSIQYGNIYLIGSRAQYRCPKVSKTFTVTCLSTGSYSNTLLYHCDCLISDGVYQATLDYRLINESFVELVLFCDEGYELLQMDSAKCNVNTGTWSGQRLTGCYRMVDKPWRKVYSYSDASGRILGSWFGTDYANDLKPDGGFLNSTVINSWPNFVQKRIRFDIMNDWKVLKNIFFNGQGTTYVNWFSKARLIKSPWSDLNAGASTAVFSIHGVNGPWNLRFAIASYVNSEEYDCMSDSGWFGMTWDYYPCDVKENPTLVTILFAKGENKAMFIHEQLSFADRVEVWIEE